MDLDPGWCTAKGQVWVQVILPSSGKARQSELVCLHSYSKDAYPEPLGRHSNHQHPYVLVEVAGENRWKVR